MNTACGFAYAQARIQSRFAELPPQEEWRRLAGARTLAGFLEEARTGPLRDWVKPLSGQSDCHDLEIGLRAVYREHVAEVAGWLPKPWRAAIGWTRWLVLMPLFDHLARGGTMPAWVVRDPDLQRLLHEDGSLGPEHLRSGDAHILLAQGSDPAAVWTEIWRQLWPPCKAEFQANMVALEALLAGHLEVFRRVSPEAAWELRHGLRERLRLLFHRRLLQPAGAFSHLALVALDMEHLRAELVTRALFPSLEAA